MSEECEQGSHRWWQYETSSRVDRQFWDGDLFVRMGATAELVLLCQHVRHAESHGWNTIGFVCFFCHRSRKCVLAFRVDGWKVWPMDRCSNKNACKA